MLRKKEKVDAPNLPESVFAAGCSRIAVISLHEGAGARTVVESIAAEFRQRGIRTGVTRAPRIPLDEPGVTDRATRIALPEDTIVATTSRLAEGHDALEPLDTYRPDEPESVGLFRVAQSCEVPVYGPDDPASMSDVLGRLAETSGGLAIADGAWERRAFAAPEVADGVVLVVGSGYSDSPHRSAAALGFVAETLSIPRCDPVEEKVWSIAAGHDMAQVLDGEGATVGVVRPDARDPAASLELIGERARTIVLPGRLHDSFLAPLIRAQLSYRLVVKDPTRLHLAPIYYKAWIKARGEFRILEPMRVVAVATNPENPRGPDAEPGEFRNMIEETVPGVPVHDVRLEASKPKPLWKLWA